MFLGFFFHTSLTQAWRHTELMSYLGRHEQHIPTWPQLILIFPLPCPVREYEWMRSWKGTIVVPDICIGITIGYNLADKNKGHKKTEQAK